MNTRMKGGRDYFIVQRENTDILKKEEGYALSINTTILFKYLAISFIFLFCMHTLAVFAFIYKVPHVYNLTHRFYFDEEANFPSFYSACNLLLSAALLGIIAFFKRKEKDTFARQWTILAFIFLYLAIDEAASVHELLINPIRIAFHTSGFLRFPWVIVGGTLFAFFGFFYLKFLLSLRKDMRFRFMVSGIIYVVGAIGFEMIGGYYFVDIYTHNTPYLLATTVEESLEMIGILLFIHTLFRYLALHYRFVSISVRHS